MTKSKSKDLKNILLGIVLIFLFLFIMLPNIEWLKSPLTPPIKIKIIDSETQKPVTDLHTVLRWVVSYAYFPGQGSVKSSHIVIARTDQNGEIIIGRKLKPLSVIIPPLFYREFIGTHILTVDHRYKWTAQNIGTDGILKLEMVKAVNIADFVSNYEKYKSWSHDNSSSEAKKLFITYRDKAIKQIKESSLKLYGLKRQLN
jgi:hypothetical protein